MDFCFCKKPIHLQLMKRKGSIFFSDGKTNSCGIAIGYIGSNKVKVLDIKIDKNGRIDVKVDETNFVLVNIYNPNPVTVQVTTLHDLDKILETIKELYDNFGWQF